MRVAIDIDGVLADVGTGLVKVLSQINKRKVDLSEITTYSLEPLGMSHEDHKKYFTREFYMNLDPIKGSEAVNCLYENNFIALVTARNQYPEVMDDTLEWLYENGFLFDKLIQSKNKVKPMKEYDLDFMVDDYHINCFNLSNQGYRSLLFTQPWNKSVSLEGSRVKRVNDWKDITKYMGQCKE